MNIENTRAARRPKLSLSFPGRQEPVARPSGRPSSLLSAFELRRLVAAMVD